MEELLRNHLLRLASLYGEATGLPMSTICRRMLHDSSFFRRIADGVGFNVKTYDRALFWFQKNWPEELPWPEEVKRDEAPAQRDAAA